mgnify:CR=1 FL=1
MTRRTDRVNYVLRQEISQLLSRELNDPRLSGLVSIIHVDTSADLHYAEVFISVMGSQEDKASTLRALTSAAGFLHRELKERLSFKFIPELRFHLDESMEEADRLTRLMHSLNQDG